jgi:hypothetical protein
MKSTIQFLLALCRVSKGIPCVFFTFGFLLGLSAEEIVDRVVSVFKHFL